MIESDFNDFYKKITSKAYNQLGVKEVLIKTNSFLLSHSNEVDYKEKLFLSSIDLAKSDIELYIRIMNLCIEESLYCLNYLFFQSSVYLIDKQYSRDIYSLDSNYQKILSNTINIVINNKLLDEIDVPDSSEMAIVFGRVQRISIPRQIFSDFEDKIFEILNKKYTKKLLENKYGLEPDELTVIVRKLNIAYTNFGKCISFSCDNFCFSPQNSENHFHKQLTSSNYDGELFNKYGILLFPLVSDVDITNNKIIIPNDGFGNLDNCCFTVVDPKTNRQIFDFNINIQCMRSENVYIDDFKDILILLPSNDHLEFKFNFKKFDNEYCFSIKKKIGPIKEELNKQVGYSVNYDLSNNSGNIAFNANNVKQSIKVNDTQSLRECYKELAKLVDETDMEIHEKEEVEQNVKEAQQELSKEDWNPSKILQLTDKIVKIVGFASKAFPVIMKIKEYLDPYVTK